MRVSHSFFVVVDILHILMAKSFNHRYQTFPNVPDYSNLKTKLPHIFCVYHKMVGNGNPKNVLFPRLIIAGCSETRNKDRLSNQVKDAVN